MYKTTGDQLSPSYQLIRESPTEFVIKIHLSNGILRHEYDLSEAIEWPPMWKKNYETMEIEFSFAKLNKKLWSSYGSRIIVNETKCIERNYREWEVINNISLNETVNLLVLRSKDFMEILPVGRHIEAKMNIMGNLIYLCH